MLVCSLKTIINSKLPENIQYQQWGRNNFSKQVPKESISLLIYFEKQVCWKLQVFLSRISFEYKQNEYRNKNEIYPRNKKVASIAFWYINCKNITNVTMKILNHLTALHIPYGTCWITTTGQKLQISDFNIFLF